MALTMADDPGVNPEAGQLGGTVMHCGAPMHVGEVRERAMGKLFTTSTALTCLLCGAEGTLAVRAPAAGGRVGVVR